MIKKLIDDGNLSCNINGETIMQFAATGSDIIRPALLLHSCCGPCSTSVIERLATDYNICVYFYNPCITEEHEYEQRKENQIKFISMFNQRNPGLQKIKFIEGEYKPDVYLKLTEGYANEPEGGKRCSICFKMRLEETCKTAKELNFELFSTTLSVSPHKNYNLISEIGRELENKYNLKFLDFDFKKKAGFQRSIQLSREYGLYRQNYCGCKYSKR